MNVLLTRPFNQSQGLADLLTNGGYKVMLFPTLKITELLNTPSKKHYDVFIFISVNAVKYGLATLKTLNYKSGKIFAVGAKTASKLNKYKIKVHAFPTQKASSNALLSMDEVKGLKNCSILILRGKGGSETLKQKLTVNNSVEYVEVYQRLTSDITDIHRDSLAQFLQNNKGVITATSIENLVALMNMVANINIDATNFIKSYSLVVFSERIKIFAKSIGFNNIYITAQNSDKGLLQAIQKISPV